MERKRYQYGTLALSPRKSGEDVWVLRYSDGQKRRSEIIGTTRQYPTKSLAEEAAASTRQQVAARRDVSTFAHLVERFRKEAMPARIQTMRSYESSLKRLEERWGDIRLDEMSENVVEIQKWLSSLRTLDGKHQLAKKSRANLKALLHRLFDRAMAWNFMPREVNPIGFVELRSGNRFSQRDQRPKRRIPLLTPEQFRAIVSDPQLPEHVRVMSYVGMFLGLRASEILALRWNDFDFLDKSVHIQRSVVGRHEEETKTEDSEAHLPFPDALKSILERWRAYLPSVNGWLFANPATGRPYHRDSIVADHLKLAGQRAGISGLGSHSFRHSYRAFMADNGVAAEWQQRLMRHSNIEMTMAYGRQKLSREMREGNDRVVNMVMQG